MTVMTYQIPPGPRDYVPPPRRPKRTPQDYARFGRGVMALGAVFFAGGLAYMLNGSSMTVGQAVIATLPLALIFVAFGWSICRMGEDGPGVMIGYLAAGVGACTLLAGLLWGK